MERASDSATMQRRRKPLLTCTISIFSIASKAYSRAQNLDSPIAKKMAKLTSFLFPLFHLFQSLVLPTLRFVDNRILYLEKIIETLFPPSAKLFDNIDNFTHIAEKLPEKFDVLDKYPTMTHRVPFLDFALVHLISWLKLFISILSHFGTNSSNEKDIVVDTTSNNEPKSDKSREYSSQAPNVNSENKARLCVSSNYESKNAVYDSSNDNNASKLPPRIDMTPTSPSYKSEIIKCSYKEILERGTKESNDKKEDSILKNNNTKDISGKSEGNNGNEDPILELFEASWHMKPAKGGRKEGSLPHTISCT